MGWNAERRPAASAARGIKTGPDGLHAYFVHSFHMAATDRSAVIAEADYGGPVTARVGTCNIAWQPVPYLRRADPGAAIHPPNFLKVAPLTIEWASAF